MLFRRDKKITLREVYEKEQGVRYFQLILGIFLVSLSFNLFILPSQIVYGVSGLGVILNKVIGISPSIVILVGDAILLLLSYIVLGKNKTRNTILGSILYPIFISLTAWIPEYIDISMAEPLVVALFGAVISGFGYGLIFKSGYTTGGTDILNEIVSKYGKMSLGNAMLFTDGIILGIGVFVFGVTKVMYSIINLYIISLMTDKVMLGISSTKAFYIITSNEKEMENYIMNELKHGVTVLEGKGAFSGHKQSVLMCVIPTREYFQVKEGIHEIDSNAFFVVADAYEVKGNK